MGKATQLGFAGAVVLSVLNTGNFARAADERPPLVGQLSPVTLVKPGQMALSPDGDRVAIADRFGNRLYVVNSRGELVWSVGEGVALEQPTAVGFASSNDLIFSQWESRLLFHVSEKTPTRIDTLEDLSDALGSRARILRLYTLTNRSNLVLTAGPNGLMRFDADWKKPTVVIKAGSGKGRLDRPVSCAELSSGRIAVVQSGAYPVQVFNLDGGFLFAADWNSPAPPGGWDATAIAIDLRQTIWIADATRGQFRQYDPNGTLLSVRAVASSGGVPAEMLITSDNQLIVASENGRLDLYDLNLEN